MHIVHGLKCLLDLDGVLADFVAAALKIHGAEWPYNKPENKGNYHIQDVFGIPQDDFWKPFEEEFWATIPPTKECHEIVDVLEEFFGDGNICILSSPTNNRGCLPGKVRWIMKNIPDYGRSFLFGTKKFFTARPGHVLIDDYDHNVNMFRQSGGDAILIPRPWNSMHDFDRDLIEYLKIELLKIEEKHNSSLVHE